MGRSDDNNRASKCFREHEWQAIYMYHKLEIPKIEPSIKEVVLLIARLSGYKYTKHSSPPGIKTMWTALKIFYPITQMFYLMSTKT